MKKVLAILLAALMICVLFAGCTKGSEDATEAPTVTDDAEQTAVTGEDAAPADDSSEDAAPADNGEAIPLEGNALIGQWEYESGGFIYTFNEDGTGEYDAAGSLMKFTYTLTDKVLSITYEGSDSSLDLNYELDGDVLNVIDSLGSDTIYNRK